VSVGLRLRLTLLSAVGVAVLSVLALLTINLVLGRQLEDRLDRQLYEQTVALDRALAVAGTGGEVLELSRDYLAGPGSETLRLGGLVLLVSLNEGGLVSNSGELRLEELTLDPEAAGGTAVTVATLLGRYRVAQTPLLLEGDNIGFIRFAAPMEEALGSRREVVLLASVLLLCGTLLLTFGAWALVGRAMIPVVRITAGAAEISHHDLTHRVPYRGPRDEIGRLAETVNGMLDRLEAAFREQESFISGVSHELRTPLTIAKGHLQVLDRAPELNAEVARAEHALVLEELDRMNRLVDELSTLARAGRVDFLRPEWIDVDSLLRGLTAQGSLLAPDRSWRADPLPGGRLLVDQDRLTQVFLNLMQNAVAHTVEGGRIALGGSMRPSGIELWVEDWGEGMEEAVRGRVFERFYRGPRAGQDEGAGKEGMGLGLAIVEALVRAHDGEVAVESRPGEGSRFVVRFPSARVRAS